MSFSSLIHLWSLYLCTINEGLVQPSLEYDKDIATFLALLFHCGRSLPTQKPDWLFNRAFTWPPAGISYVFIFFSPYCTFICMWAYFTDTPICMYVSIAENYHRRDTYVFIYYPFHSHSCAKQSAVWSLRSSPLKACFCLVTIPTFLDNGQIIIRSLLKENCFPRVHDLRWTRLRQHPECQVSVSLINAWGH